VRFAPGGVLDVGTLLSARTIPRGTAASRDGNDRPYVGNRDYLTTPVDLAGIATYALGGAAR